ncbi:hypothetical protein K438DRAFT_1174269 [Mycena galopus ATCC 62051]|nr:hypothetical protein K438DRAFT_1174269 [Mycena galopus ATCC 62051]
MEIRGGQVLWCSGIAGAGKTVLCSIVVQHLRTNAQNNNIGVAAIYLSHIGSDAHFPAKILAALWRQLVFPQPPMQEHELVLKKSISTLQKLYEVHHKQDTESPRQERQLVLEKSISSVQKLYEVHHEQGTQPSIQKHCAILGSVISGYSKVYLILDALDECPDIQRDLLLKSLSLLVPPVNLMLTSRPDIVNNRHFTSFMALEIRATPEDIRAYLCKRIQNRHDFPGTSVFLPICKKQLKRECFNAVMECSGLRNSILIP